MFFPENNEMAEILRPDPKVMFLAHYFRQMVGGHFERLEDVFGRDGEVYLSGTFVMHDGRRHKILVVDQDMRRPGKLTEMPAFVTSEEEYERYCSAPPTTSVNEIIGVKIEAGMMAVNPENKTYIPGFALILNGRNVALSVTGYNDDELTPGFILGLPLDFDVEE